MEDYRHLQQLFGAWFHQDWALEAPDWQGVLRLYTDENPRHEVSAVVRDLEVLLAAPYSDSELEHKLINEFGCCYTPRPDIGGPSWRQWLIELRTALAANE